MVGKHRRDCHKRQWSNARGKVLTRERMAHSGLVGFIRTKLDYCLALSSVTK